VLDIQHLKDFLAIARHKHFGRAADECHVSTSGLSRRIQTLEHWLGVPVLNRSSTGVELTDAGQRLLSVAAEVVYALDGVKRSVRADAASRREQVRFAAPHIMSAVFFPGWFPVLHKQFASTRFSVTSDHLHACFEALNSGEEDFVVFLKDSANGVTARLDGILDMEHCHLCVIGSERLVAVSSADAKGKAVHSLDGPGKHPVALLSYREECSLAWALERDLPAFDDLPDFLLQHENSLADGLRTMVLAGLGVAWIPASMVEDDLARQSLVRASRRNLDIVLDIVVARRKSPLNDRAEAFWSYLVEFSLSRSAATDRLKAVLASG
jgi:DNA-binding transcriptional LysR family regulator